MKFIVAHNLLVINVMKTGQGFTQSQYPGVVQRLTARYIHLLAKSCERYSKLKRAQAPEILVDIEKVLIRQRLLLLFNFNSDLTN